MKRLAFTMLELVFVIVIMGIIGKFGVEFLANAYRSFIYANINHNLQSNSAMAVELIASRLQYRIKDSIIARDSSGFVSLNDASGNTYNVLEWIASDIDGFRGISSNAAPNWSGIIDVSHPTALATNNILVSPETNTSLIDSTIQALSDSTIDDAALYFIGSNSDINTSYGWTGNRAYIQDQNGSIHPINDVIGQINQFQAASGSNFSGVDIFEYYKLAWTAYAISLDTGTNELKLHYDYQPWDGDTYLLQRDGTATKSSLIMQNVDTFQFMAIGSLVKIQVCIKSDIIDGDSSGGYSLCKEKTIY